MTHRLPTIHQSQGDHANGSLIDNIPTYNDKLELYFDCILKLENVAVVTKQNPKELALGKIRVAVIKCLKSLLPDTSWNSVKAVLSRDGCFL